MFMEEGDFEQTLIQLETLVTSLEDGRLSLEDSISSFEKGMALLRRAETLLKEAQQRIEIWSADTDGVDAARMDGGTGASSALFVQE
jgi:exodeoxyribonuclease VII small subunit